MQLSEMETALKRYGFSDDDPLTNWINWGMHELVKAHPWPFLETYLTISTTVGDGEYQADFNINYAKINGDAQPLQYMTLNSFAREFPDDTVRGHPEYYTLLSNFMQFYPVPDAVYMIKVVGRQAEPDLVDPTDEPSWIPPSMHHLIVVRAAVFALNAENEEDRAQAKLDEFNDMLPNHISSSGQHNDGPLYVQDVT
jgi:hypothetical protein